MEIYSYINVSPNSPDREKSNFFGKSVKKKWKQLDNRDKFVYNTRPQTQRV